MNELVTPSPSVSTTTKRAVDQIPINSPSWILDTIMSVHIHSYYLDLVQETR